METSFFDRLRHVQAVRDDLAARGFPVPRMTPDEIARIVQALCRELAERARR